MSFLQLEGKKFLIVGVFNKKSIAYHAAKCLEQEGAECIYVVKDDGVKEKVRQFIPDANIFSCNVEKQDEIENLYRDISTLHTKIDGMLHSIAFANFSEGLKPFHETKKKDFLQAIDISCYSLINLSYAFKDILDKNASVVTLSVPFTKIAVETYGYMAPVKAALESSVVYLAQSFSQFSQVRFNVVSANVIKTSSAAGLPDYIKLSLYAESLTFRKKAIETKEIANVITFLLSGSSSAINGQSVVADAGMIVNLFDREVLEIFYKNKIGIDT
ncbi:enoyl-ACP reductase FabI [Candidatus Magnetominusculus dajiuhuensis]|uniref:enoyl-ACP reductase FabI n=1 Tax=Candidatus Magnetominusculus dajiuhuensis TaxID=3137712 RepID=UPI003B428C6F